MSLSEIAKQYENTKKQREKHVQALRTEIERSIEDHTIASLKLQNHKVNQIHKNQQAIEAKLRKQQELMAEFRNHQQAWVNLYEQLNRALMKAGDLAHYAGYVEAEIKELVGEGTVAAFLEQAERQQKQHGGQKIQTISQEQTPERVLTTQEKHQNISGQIVSEPIEADT